MILRSAGNPAPAGIWEPGQPDNLTAAEDYTYALFNNRTHAGYIYDNVDVSTWDFICEFPAC
jgi:hypothetical protein